MRPATRAQASLSRGLVAWYTGAVISLASIASDMLITAFDAIDVIGSGLRGRSCSAGVGMTSPVCLRAC